jgi:DNA N-6-adenine-methyltransferase (Dam)
MDDRPAQLTRYEAARFALAEATRIDEVRSIVDRAAALAEYGRRSKDTRLLRDATRLRFDAERKGGALLRKMAAEGARDLGRGGDRKSRSFQTTVKLDDLGVSKDQSSKWQRLADLPADKYEIRVEHAVARVENMTTSAPGLLRKGGYTGENEWFTPAVWVERARQVLGEIDVDPASHVIAQETVRAKTFYTVADNGLEQPWSGRIWLNPPYERRLLPSFVGKLLSAYASGEVTEALMLVHAYTDVGWFHDAARAAASVCFPRGRIQFVAPSGDKCAQMQSQVFFFFGRDDSAFRRTFGSLGVIMRAV